MRYLKSFCVRLMTYAWFSLCLWLVTMNAFVGHQQERWVVIVVGAIILTRLDLIESKLDDMCDDE